MANLTPAAVNTTPKSLIDGMILGDKTQWDRFCNAYRPWLVYKATMIMRGEHKQDIEDVVQNVLMALLDQGNKERFSYRRQAGRFRSYLATCIWHAWSATKNKPRPVPSSPATEIAGATPRGDDDRVSYYLATLATVISEIRSAGILSNPKKWICFSERILNNRPSAALAAELGISIDSVDQYVRRTLLEMIKVCRERLESETGESGLFRDLERDGPKVMKELIQYALVDVDQLGLTHTPDKTRDYFQAILRPRLPTLRAKYSKRSWQEFVDYTESVADGDAVDPAGSAVASILSGLEQICRQRCLADDGDHSRYDFLIKFNENAIALICGKILAEEKSHDPR